MMVLTLVDLMDGLLGLMKDRQMAVDLVYWLVVKLEYQMVVKLVKMKAEYLDANLVGLMVHLMVAKTVY